MINSKKAYLEHVAIHVKDIHWHIRFFREVFGLTLRLVDGDEVSPVQVWTLGGLQLISDPNFKGPEGRLAHLGMMAEDVEAAIAAANTFEGISHLEKGKNWLVLPDNMIVEILQADNIPAIREALAINPRKPK